jgi:diaminohydroxyphosphoribosylaminopyrimidine deaminase / 5-amino-6-(5-phosphoribosylamino)uracil reductase
METPSEEYYMQIALDLARKGIGRVNPNPLVGAVIVKNGEIISSGYHHYFGGLHAEVDAINNSSEPVEGADLYVTLEPCSYFGKTPPCTQLLIKSKIKRVIVAMEDPNPLVSGKGIELLKKHGIEVKTGILEKEAEEMNRVFTKYIRYKQPYVILKTAMTMDGKTASRTGDSKWISSESSRQKVHELRNEFRGILIGVGTIIADDPELTCRLASGNARNPARIIADSKGRIPLSANVLQDPENNPVILLTTEQCSAIIQKKLTDAGHKLILVPIKKGRVDLNIAMKRLAEAGIDGILLEGGSTLNEAALKCGIVDEVCFFIAPKLLGGKNALTAMGGEGFSKVSEAITLDSVQVETSGEDILIRARVNKKIADKSN